MAKTIAVVDYHKGNLSSVARSLSAVGGTVTISDDLQEIMQADALVIPGVGSFEDAMISLKKRKETEAIRAAAQDNRPILGICLGLQVLCGRGSEREAQAAKGGTWVKGLGLLKGSVDRLHSDRLKIPHVGWDQLHLAEQGKACPLFAGIPEGANVYFTHSYAVMGDIDPEQVAAKTFYGEPFASAVWANNIYGVQFHPEKSSTWGLTMLKNFVHIVEGEA